MSESKRTHFPVCICYIVNVLMEWQTEFYELIRMRFNKQKFYVHVNNLYPSVWIQPFVNSN